MLIHIGAKLLIAILVIIVVGKTSTYVVKVFESINRCFGIAIMFISGIETLKLM